MIMHLIVCIEDHDGMSFCGRRLSSDRILTEYILQLTAENALWMNAYSANIFPQNAVHVDEDFLQKAGIGEYCFVETEKLTQLPDLESIILCKWNRCYPATCKFPRELLKGMSLKHREDFPGNSHDKITVERYVL